MLENLLYFFITMLMYYQLPIPHNNTTRFLLLILQKSHTLSTPITSVLLSPPVHLVLLHPDIAIYIMHAFILHKNGYKLNMTDQPTL